jgi:outer membrane protein assembly factor BamB
MKTRAFIVILFTLIFVACAVCGIADNFDWPRWRGPNGNGISMEKDWNPEALAGSPKILWNVNIRAGYSNVVIKDNRLYTMGTFGGENIVYCLNAETGEEVWRYSFMSGYDSLSTPTIEGKFIYSLSADGIMFCLKAKNGKLRWKKNIITEYDVKNQTYGFACSPVIEKDFVILNANLSGIALHKKTGEKVWISEKYHHELSVGGKMLGGYATPVLYDYQGKKYALIYNFEGLCSVNINTGEQLWFHKGMTHVNAADPILFYNKVFISTGYNVGCTLLDMAGNKPKILWQNKNMRNHFASCVLVDGYLYGSDGDVGGWNRFLCLDFNTGEIMWEERMKTASLIAADGKLIVLEENGILHIAEATPSSYKEISSCDVLEGERKSRMFYTPPVLCNGKIYCRNYAGDLVSIDVSK